MIRKRHASIRPGACPICRAPRQQPGLPPTVPLGIPTYWSPDEALAVFEIVSEMRDIIAALYASSLEDAARDQYRPPHSDPDNNRQTE